MSTETLTPRTDAAVAKSGFMGEEKVTADFARRLERELAAVTRERDEARAKLTFNTMSTETPTPSLTDFGNTFTAPCQNVVEHSDLTAHACQGELHYGPLDYDAPCDTCGARCGRLVAFHGNSSWVTLVREQLAEANARGLALREALHWTVEILDAHEVETLDCDRRGEKYCTCLERQLAKARAALNSPPPPVVAKEDAEKLAEALKQSMQIPHDGDCQFTDKADEGCYLCQEAEKLRYPFLRDALAAYRAKHPETSPLTSTVEVAG